MANGVPVRLSAALTERARSAAVVHDRSLTDQVEHWARLGQQVEAVISASTVERLKALSHDEHLPELLATADTPEWRAKVVTGLRKLHPVRYGVDERGAIIGVTRSGKRTKPPSSR